MRLPAQKTNLSRDKGRPVSFIQTVGTRSRLAPCESGSLQGGFFASPWQRERAKILHRICSRIAARVALGQQLRSAVTYFAWACAHRVYRCEPSRRLHLSRQTVLRAYYHWRANGKTPAAFALRYRPSRAKLSQAQLSSFLRACVSLEVCSYAAAYRRCGEFLVTESAYHHALSWRVRKHITALFAQRRRCHRAKRLALAAIVDDENAKLSNGGNLAKTEGKK